jgi:hypothetical protein
MEKVAGHVPPADNRTMTPLLGDVKQKSLQFSLFILNAGPKTTRRPSLGR